MEEETQEIDGSMGGIACVTAMWKLVRRQDLDPR